MTSTFPRVRPQALFTAYFRAPSHRLLAFLIINFVVAGIGLQYFTVYLYRHHRIPAYCDGTVIHPLHDMLSRYQETDSWNPMLQALKASSQSAGIYPTVFFVQKTKFQYPLASLIPVDLLSRTLRSDYVVVDTLKWLSILAFLAQIPLLFFILSKSFKTPQSPILLLALAVILVLSFYPLARAYAAGQIQIFLDLLFSAAFLEYFRGKELTSGFLLGLAILVKPQYGLFLLWAALRKRWRFLKAATAALSAGAILAILFYGWRNNVQYFDVIRYMGRHGEAYYANQSVNGLLNRLLQNGSNTFFDMRAFAPYVPLVYVLTLLSSATILVIALFTKRPHGRFGEMAEFSLLAIASTAASPIAWEHHYGVLLPVFAWLLGSSTSLGKRFGVPAILLICFVLCADDFKITNLLAGVSPWNILQSTLFCGALILLFHLRFLINRPIESTER